MTHAAPAGEGGAAARRPSAPSPAGDGGGDATTHGLPRVRFVADLVCPWCYVGFHRLTRLAERHPLRLVWHPFLLNPHLPPGGVPRRHYLERKFGGAAHADAVHGRVVAAAAAEGLALRLERIGRQPSTVAAHAMLLAAGERRAPALARALFEAFFRDGLDLGSEAVLAGLGAPFGAAPPPPSSAAAREGAAEVMAAHDAACRSGVDGVPVFLFGDDHAIAGAQPPACLEALLHLERYRTVAFPSGGAAAPGPGATG